MYIESTGQLLSSAPHSSMEANTGIAVPDAHILILGPPGSGKTTLSRELCTRFVDVDYISLGAITRSLEEDHPFRIELNKTYVENKPVGDPDLFTGLLRPTLEQTLEAGRGFILDGMPKKVEEVDPLVEMLRDLGVRIDAMLMCQINPLASLSRVNDRKDEREDKENLGTALNRTLKYYEDIDGICALIGGYLGDKIITVDTDTYSPQDAANTFTEKYLDMRASSMDIVATHHPIHEVGKVDKIKSVTESIEGTDDLLLRDRLADFLMDGCLLDDARYMYMDGLATPEEQLAHLDSIIISRYPEMEDTPKMRARYVGTLKDSIFGSMDHMVASLRDEVALRAEESPEDTTHVATVVAEMYRAVKVIAEYQDRNENHEHFSSVVNDEIAVNVEDLDAIECYLQTEGMMPEDATIEQLFKLQPELWRVLTSNQIIVSQDSNYRKASNGVPSSHHSLAPPFFTKRNMIASPIGEYRPFIEAVSVDKKSGFYTTFGFLHTVGHDSEGQSYQIEFPILMLDEAIGNHDNVILKSMINRAQKLYFNHDLWHNMLPVYADHFRLQHPLSPISQAGEKSSYLEFGRAMRKEKEDYEIGVAMAHARTQQDRIERDELYRTEQLSVIDSLIADIPDLHQQLVASDDKEFADRVIDYICTVATNRILLMLPADHPYIDRLDSVLSQVDLPEQLIEQKDLLQLLFTQNIVLASSGQKLEFLLSIEKSTFKDPVLKKKIQDAIIPTLHKKHENMPREIIDSILTDAELTSISLRAISDTNPLAESGSKELMEALEEIGLTDLLHSDKPISLKGVNRMRWQAINSPQREQLKGHLEKVHKKKGITFDEQMDVDPRNLVAHQYAALKKDVSEYDYRKWARKENEQLSQRMYNLLFDDGQVDLKRERELLRVFQLHEKSGEGTDISSGIGVLDAMLDDLIAADYDRTDQHNNEIRLFTEKITTYSPELASILQTLASDYSMLASQEKAYLAHVGTTYLEAREKYEENLMQLTE